MNKFTDLTRFSGRNLAVLAVLAMTTTFAHAQHLLNDPVTGEIVGPGAVAFQVVPFGNTVGSGVEFRIEFLGTPAFEVDIGGGVGFDPVPMSVVSVFGQPISTGAGEVLVLGDLDSMLPGVWWIGGIINFQTNQGPGISIGDVTFTNREVRFAMASNIWAADGFASWDVVFVPAPSSLALLGLGGLLAMRRRR